MIRVRFAPSPTGYLHIGSARTFIFNWLFARRNQGTMILRIDDTDVERNSQTSLDSIYDGLKWLDLTMRAAQRIKGPVPGSAWATLADWRGFVWRQLLKPEVDPSGQELVVRIAVQRATSGSPWIAVDSPSVTLAGQLRAQGILRQNDLFPDRYRPEHDLLQQQLRVASATRTACDAQDLYRHFILPSTANDS